MMENEAVKLGISKHTLANKAGFFLVCATIIWTTMIYGTVHQPVLALFYLAVTFILILWAVDSFRSGEIRVDKSLFQFAIAATAIYGFIQVIPYGYEMNVGGVDSIPKTLSIAPFATGVVAMHFVALLIFVAALLVHLHDRKRLWSLTRLIAVFGFIYAFYAILQMVLSPDKIYGIYASEFASPFGSFVNRHNFAAYMEMTLAVPLGLLFAGAIHKDKKLLYVTAISVMGVALLLSGSRGGLVSAVAGVGFLLFIAYGRHGKRKMLVRVLATGSIIAAIVAGAIMIGGETSLTRIAETASSNDFTTNRRVIWSAATGVIKDNILFGVGLGAFGIAYSTHDSLNGMERVEQAHNDYLEVLADAGLIGAVIGIVFIVFLFRSGFRAIKARDPVIRGAASGAFAGIFSILVHSMFDFVLHTTAVTLMFLTLAAIVGCCDRLRGFEAPKKLKRKKRRAASVTPINERAST